MLKTLLNLFVAFTKIGVLGYGGGPAMIPLIREEVVDNQTWMTDADFTDTLAMGNTLPGPIATKMSFFIGYKVGNWLGAFVALLGLLWPSLVLMMIMGLFFLRFKDAPYTQSMLKAVRPVVVALLAFTAYKVLIKLDGMTWQDTLKGKNWDAILIMVVSFVGVSFLDIHPALTILAAAILGLIVYR